METTIVEKRTIKRGQKITGDYFTVTQKNGLLRCVKNKWLIPRFIVCEQRNEIL